MIIANILYWILLGFLAGVIASMIMRRAYQKNELNLNMGVGMAGALIGSWMVLTGRQYSKMWIRSRWGWILRNTWTRRLGNVMCYSQS